MESREITRMEMELDEIKRGQKVVSEEDIRKFNEQIWQEGYEKAITPEDFAKAVELSATLEEIAEKNKFFGETMGRICLTGARLIYYRDKKAGKASNEAYEKAMKGLEYAEDVGTKVSLYNVASDAMNELVRDHKIAAELAEKSCRVAEESGDDVAIGKAENNVALRYLNTAKQFASQEQRQNREAKASYEKAISHFKKVQRAHQRAGDNRQIGHAHSNMILCYVGLAGISENDSAILFICDQALVHAKLAIKAYGGLGDERNRFHALGANYRKGVAFRERARYSGKQEDLIEAIRCFTENATIYFELGKFEKVKQELTNIAETIEALKEIEK